MRRTLKKSLHFQGVGLHSGEATSVTLHGASSGRGYVVRFPDGDCPLNEARRNGDGRGTVLSFGEHRLMTVEHLLSSLRGLGVDDVIIEPRGVEVPLLDGSGVRYCQALLEAGFVDQDGEVQRFCVSSPVSVSSPDGTKMVMALPDHELRFTYVIDYPDTAIGTQMVTLTVTPDSFVEKLGQCRTFCLYHEVEAMRKQGLGLGGSLDSALVVDGQKLLTPGGLRCPDEYVRHKVLDMLGDLSLLGLPLTGHFVGLRAGHAMHLKLVDRLQREALSRR